MNHAPSLNAHDHQGHWILARMGKRVLRPGGKTTTLKLLDHLDITAADDLVEFAPGLGATAMLALRKQPRSYTGIEKDPEASERLRRLVRGENRRILTANAAASTLADASADKVWGEAMLTMQADHRKQEIISEAYRILRPGGLYGIHELALKDSVTEEGCREVQCALAESIEVNARPMTLAKWQELLRSGGFCVREASTAPMRLLEPGRLVADEGLLRAIMIGFNILSHPAARKRIVEMRRIFRKYSRELVAISIVGEKIQGDASKRFSADEKRSPLA